MCGWLGGHSFKIDPIDHYVSSPILIYSRAGKSSQLIKVSRSQLATLYY